MSSALVQMRYARQPQSDGTHRAWLDNRLHHATIKTRLLQPLTGAPDNLNFGVCGKAYRSSAVLVFCPYMN
jgi:hypothetical protein